MQGDTAKCPRNCPSGTFWNIIAQRCTSCLTNYAGGTGACTTTDKPLCNINSWVCEACPTGYEWDTLSNQCIKETIKGSGSACFTTDSMTCVGGYILSTEPFFPGIKPSYVDEFYYMKIKAMYKDITNENIKIKHLYVGNNTANWSIDLTKPNEWSDEKEIQLYKGPETGNRGTPSRINGSVFAPVIGASMGKCSPNTSTPFSATVCIEYELYNEK